ncbi:MAG: septum formation protein Maf, partial [Chloroflexales bacterium]|nr:septum formation protein Maf [Chloroflexales bacterium]
MDRPRLVLASASPRRHELLTALGAIFTVIATDAEEADVAAPPEIASALPLVAVPPHHHPTLLAWRKAMAAAAQAPDAVVLGADTVVVLDDRVLNKPVDAAHARAMLHSLAGRTHSVYTGLCVVAPAPERGGSGQTLLDVVATEVVFHALDGADIAAYVATGEPLDKAGAYGVQGLGGRLVRAVRGSFTAVVGFPLVAAHHLLTTAGITGLSDPSTAYQRWLCSQR